MSNPRRGCTGPSFQGSEGLAEVSQGTCPQQRGEPWRAVGALCPRSRTQKQQREIKKTKRMLLSLQETKEVSRRRSLRLCSWSTEGRRALHPGVIGRESRLPSYCLQGNARPPNLPLQRVASADASGVSHPLSGFTSSRQGCPPRARFGWGASVRCRRQHSGGAVSRLR